MGRVRQRNEGTFEGTHMARGLVVSWRIEGAMPGMPSTARSRLSSTRWRSTGSSPWWRRVRGNGVPTRSPGPGRRSSSAGCSIHLRGSSRGVSSCCGSSCCRPSTPDARTLLGPIANDSALLLERLRATMASAALLDAGAPLSFERLAAEFSVRSVEAFTHGRSGLCASSRVRAELRPVERMLTAVDLLLGEPAFPRQAIRLGARTPDQTAAKRHRQKQASL